LVFTDKYLKDWTTAHIEILYD